MVEWGGTSTSPSPSSGSGWDRAADAADFDLLHLLFHDREEDLQKTRWQQPALFALDIAMARCLTTLSIRPVAMGRPQFWAN